MRKSPLKRQSEKKRLELLAEKKLAVLLWTRQQGLCADCGKPLGWGSSKHEIKFRSRGGDPTDESNCKLLCVVCAAKPHGIKVVLSEPQWSRTSR